VADLLRGEWRPHSHLPSDDPVSLSPMLPINLLQQGLPNDGFGFANLFPQCSFRPFELRYESPNQLFICPFPSGGSLQMAAGTLQLPTAFGYFWCPPTGIQVSFAAVSCLVLALSQTRTMVPVSSSTVNPSHDMSSLCRFAATRPLRFSFHRQAV
jgi:hypothetical protein